MSRLTLILAPAIIGTLSTPAFSAGGVAYSFDYLGNHYACTDATADLAYHCAREACMQARPHAETVCQTIQRSRSDWTVGAFVLRNFSIEGTYNSEGFVRCDYQREFAVEAAMKDCESSGDACYLKRVDNL